MESENIFKGQIDRFKGVTVNSNEEAKLNIEELGQKLKNSILKWKEEASFNDCVFICSNKFIFPRCLFNTN